MTPSPDLSSLAAATQEIYERNAARFDAERSRRLHEHAWLDRFLDLVIEGGWVLDLGCGTGDPIAAYMVARGFQVIGVDTSRAMLDISRSRFPAGDWRHGDMRALDLPERFDGILGWNSFFHLTPDEQRATLPVLAVHMSPGAALMLTVGPKAGEVAGHVGDDAVYHASLAPTEYAAILKDLGLSILQFVKEDPQCELHTILLARKQGE
jgi:SAM-dependent methyltransferase